MAERKGVNIVFMQKYLLFFIVIFCIFPALSVESKAVLAASSVMINNISSSQSTTDVKIETNGQVNTFHTEGNETVDWKSTDGKSTVKINTGGGNTGVKTENQVNVSANATVNVTEEGNQTALKGAEEKVEVGNLRTTQMNIFMRIVEEMNRFRDRIFNFVRSLFR